MDVPASPQEWDEVGYAELWALLDATTAASSGSAHSRQEDSPENSAGSFPNVDAVALRSRSAAGKLNINLNLPAVEEATPPRGERAASAARIKDIDLNIPAVEELNGPAGVEFEFDLNEPAVEPEPETMAENEQGGGAANEEPDLSLHL